MADGLAAWIRLEQTRGIGPETARALLAAFGLPENIFSASFSALSQVVPARIARALQTAPPPETNALIARIREWLRQPGNQLITLADAGYPKALLNIPDPPVLLYATGRLELLSRPAIAIVGSRNATVQGKINAEQFAAALSRAGFTIVSGMALGIDTAAHQGSLSMAAQSETGSTIAVVGTGLDIVYPDRNRSLAERVATQGCLISEYPAGMPPLAANFPRRNRLISGLAAGVLVVEAAAHSGSLITARLAAEQGREVFAIPGSIHSPLSRGCHQLIKEGAKLVESAQDIIDELRSWQADELRTQALPDDHHNASRDKNDAEITALLAALGHDPVNLNLLAERLALDISVLTSQLLKLELEGQVECLPGNMYRRLH